MNRLRPFMPKRAISNSMAKARTRKDAAVQLVMVEFSVDRLEREMSHMKRKMALCGAELARKDKHRRKLVAKIIT